MAETVFATKGNLMTVKNSLKLSTQGYELLDKKRTILINEMMRLIKVADKIQSQIDSTFTKAYQALQKANVVEGISMVRQISQAIPVDNSISIRFRSVMGVEIPEISYKEQHISPTYGFMGVVIALDEAYVHFEQVRRLTLQLAEIETAVYRLAVNIKKTQKRANALKNMIIPRYETIVHDITNVLEEKDREEFTRLKVIKKQKGGSHVG